MLLADSVEGATRAMDEHTPQRIEDVVRKVINNKFIDGQLDECNLTLREIDTIASTFVRVLSAMYHGRVKYPEKSNGNNPKKSSKEDPDSPKPRSSRRRKRHFVNLKCRARRPFDRFCRHQAHARDQ